jgi:hypothetical protein
MTNWRATALPIAILVTLAGCAGPERLDTPKARFEVDIAPYATHEECIAMHDGERIGYFFEARVPVTFTIQYKEGNAVIIPLTRDATTDESGDYTADHDQTYCLTWKAGVEGSAIAYRLRKLNSAP